VLGNFRVLKGGQPLAFHNASKTKGLLSCLALARSYCGVSREVLLQILWPDVESTLAGQSLNSLVHSLRKLLRNQLDGAAPVVYVDGCYRLNVEAGIAIDAAVFESLASIGERQQRAGDQAAAMASYRDAVNWYRGDLCVDADVQTLMIGESLRARYLTLLARLAIMTTPNTIIRACLDHTLRLLTADPCREDGHRLVIALLRAAGPTAHKRCANIVFCESILRTEFDAAPEPATTDRAVSSNSY